MTPRYAQSRSPVLKSVFLNLCILLVHHVLGASSDCGSEGFTMINDCVCLGYNTVYECTAVGNGFTHWSGSAFQCQGLGNEIFLSHNNFNGGIRKECNNGAIVGRSLRVNGTCYTSQLTVNISANLNGTTIDCTYDTANVLERIGSTSIVITRDPFPPPENVHVVDVKPGKLMFSWTPTALYCSALTYEILSDCGECPTATDSTMVTCTIQISQPRRCTFAVRSIVCGNIAGSWTNGIEVILRVPDPPAVTEILSRYDPKNLLALDVKFNHSYKDSFNISAGFDGSITHYTVNFSDIITGDTCASLIISPASCLNTCVSTLPLSCFPLNGMHNITISVSASNRLGKGHYNSVVIDTTNQYVSVTTESFGRITCNFLNQQDVNKEKMCSVSYGQCVHKFTRRVQSSIADGSLISIQLHDITESELIDYCYVAIASYDTFSVLMEGNFSSSESDGVKLSSGSCAVEVALLSVMLALFLMVTASLVVFMIWICRRRFKVDKKDKLFKGEHPMPSQASGQQEESIQAHAHFVLPHKPWELLNALKIFKDKNIADIRIMQLNESSKKIYILFEENPSQEEAECIYKSKLLELKVYGEPEYFVDLHDESGTEGHAVHKYERKLPPKSGSLHKLLEGIHELSKQNSDYGLINITGITVKSSSDKDGSKNVALWFILKPPTNWKEEFDKIKF